MTETVMSGVFKNFEVINLKRLEQLRKDKGKKQVDVAKYLGVEPRTIRKYETGENEPNVAKLKALAEFYDVSVDYIIEFSDNPERH